jgi:hypothetical protein
VAGVMSQECETRERLRDVDEMNLRSIVKALMPCASFTRYITLVASVGSQEKVCDGRLNQRMLLGI